MKRILLAGPFLLFLGSCQAPGERSALPPLPDKVTPQPYAQLLQRARTQVSKANDAFYVDSWTDLEEAARGLEQTAQYLMKAEDVPAKHRDTLTHLSGDLGKLAQALRDAAVAKDIKKTNDIMAKLHSKVRDMRLAD
jgi:hypothetical protein